MKLPTTKIPCVYCHGTGNEIDIKALGARLVKMRHAVGLAALEVAHRAELSPQFVTDVEKGRRKPWPDSLARWLKALRS